MPPTNTAREPGLGTFVIAGGCTVMAAFGVWTGLVRAGVFDEFFLDTAFTYPGPSLLFAAGCAVLVGLVAAFAPTYVSAARRASVVCLLLTLVAVGAAALRTGPFAPEFDAGAFRAARAARDGTVLEDQAALAAAPGVLEGKSRVDVRRLLGPPDERARRNRRWAWDVETLSSDIEDRRTLDVRFGPDGRVRSVDAPPAVVD